MHSAPAVRYPVARSWRAGSVPVLLAGTALAVCGWWWRQGTAFWPLAVVLASVVPALAVGLFQWRGMRPGLLHWDGAHWWWSDAADATQRGEYAVVPDLRLDLQHGLLLRLHGLPRGTRWRYLERSARPQSWNDLRRALYAPVPVDAAGAPSPLAP
ncbi:hypothetical protein [Pseudorhodoferax sp.]|uniref:hypothetical protein n=1 Tax=Pseudorhodoferax sp. TaxID=1993553 RepID=UPI0039E37EAC